MPLGANFRLSDDRFNKSSRMLFLGYVGNRIVLELLKLKASNVIVRATAADIAPTERSTDFISLFNFRSSM